MSATPPHFRYVIVSPAKDEEAFALQTIESVAAQTVLPTRWVIVDDGSQDKTFEIAIAQAKLYPWISVKRIERDQFRNPGPAVVVAFNVGLQELWEVDYDFVVKLDMDLILPNDYFEQLLSRFQASPRLGIASGTYLEQWNNEWVPIHMPAYHAAGASKVMRRECFEAIGGFVTDLGWDSVDEIRAQTRGWDTKHFPELTFRHLRQEGRGVGLVRNSRKNGVAYYLMGGGLFFLCFKIPYRMLFTKPFLVGGLAVFWGYLSCFLTGRKRLVTDAESKLYRKLLQSQLWSSRRKPTREEIPA